MTPAPDHDPAELVAAVLDALAAGDADAAQALAALAPTPDDDED